MKAFEHTKPNEQPTAIVTLAVALFGLSLWLVLAWLTFTRFGGNYAIWILGLNSVALAYSSIGAVAILVMPQAHVSKQAIPRAIAVLVINAIYVAATVIAVVGLSVGLPLGDEVI